MASKEEVEAVHRFEGKTQRVGNKIWVNGKGADGGVMIVVDYPTPVEAARQTPFSDAKFRILKSAMAEVGFDTRKSYWTYLVKYPCSSKPKSTDIKACRTMLEEEMAKVQPKLIVCPGSFILSGMLGTKYPISRCRGDIIEVEGQKYLPVHDLLQIEKNPELEPAFKRDLKLAANAQKDVWFKPPEVNVTVFHTAEEIDKYFEYVRVGRSNVTLSLDCEWDGRNWMDPDRYFRTIQIGLDNRNAICIEISKEGGERCCEEASVLAAVKRLLEHHNVSIIGQNVIADGEWLLSYGIDIRHNVVFDTMLAEYILNSSLPVGLEELSMKYSEFGRYSTAVELWTHQNARKCKTGYGQVPRDMLMSYAGYDVCCLFDIMGKQLAELISRGYLKARGANGEYPSLFSTTMRTQEIIYELEINGMAVDMDRLKSLIDTYQKKRSELLSMLTTEAIAAGMESFNPNSTADKRTLLYDKLGITPVRTTDGRDWGDAVANVGIDYDEEVSAGTDKNTLAILASQNPIARHLIWYNAINQACKTWLKYPDEDGEGGLIADLWADGRLHSHLSQLTATGRLRSSSPNCFPGWVEVLTEKGWVCWDELYCKENDKQPGDRLKLAQWDVNTNEITFAEPNFYVKHEQECVHVFTDTQVDIICTPDHRFTLRHRKTGKLKQVCAKDLVYCSEYTLPQAGRIVKDGIRLSQDQVTVICAIQADGYLVPNGGIDWRFDKKRKFERLAAALDRLEIYHRCYVNTSNDRNRYGIYVGKNSVPTWAKKAKHFGPWILKYDGETLGLFSEEVWLWDGCANRRTMYASADKVNSDFVQILCLLNNHRAKIRRYVSNTGSVSWQVDASSGNRSYLANSRMQNTTVTSVFCANMPGDTVIVRYNDHVAFTNQCQNWPKRAEGVIGEVFKNNMPPSLRTIVVPPKDWVMIEGDYSTAEIVTLAHLSGDPNMLKVVNTPGMDMHDKSAVDGFGFHMVDEDGNDVTLDRRLELMQLVWPQEVVVSNP